MQLTEHSSQRSDPKRRAVCATSSWPFRFAGVLLPAFILALFCVVFFLFFWLRMRASPDGRKGQTC